MNIMTGMFVVFSIATYFYITNRVFRYYSKFSFFALSALFYASVYIPLMLWRPRSPKNAILSAWSLKKVGTLFGLEWEVRGTENIVQNSGCVVLINHQSMLDLLVLSELWPIMPNCTVIAKKEIFYIWPFGLATWLWGTIFIDRLNSEGAKNTINETAATINERQSRLLMFPEGTRHGGESLLPFKKGAFHVAVQSQCPIQPVVVSRYYYIDHKIHTFDSGKTVVSILPAISTKGLNKENVNQLIRDVYKLMNDKYIDLTKEVSLEYSKNTK